MNSSTWKLVVTSPRRIQPGVRHRNWSIRILGHRINLILVIVLSIALYPWVQLLKARTARLQESYVLFDVFSRDHELDKGKAISRSQYSIAANATRRLLVFPQNEKIPPWDPPINTWQVRRHLTEESLLFVRMNVADVTYFLDLDFRSHLIWINCKWTPEDTGSTWTKLVDKFKPSQLQGPNGLYVPKHENWCDTRLCAQLNLYGDGSSSCQEDLCHFSVPYGREEIIDGVVIRDDAVLSNSSVPVNDKSYRRLNLVFGCVYKQRSKATGKRIKHQEKLGSDGVLGLNQWPLSFPSQLYERNVAERSIVLCLAKTKGVIAGYIAFGFPVKQMGDGVPWVPLDYGAGGTYQVLLRNIKYGDNIVMLGELLKRKFDIIIDGSLRFIYLDNAILVPFVKIVKRWAQANGFDFQDVKGEEGTCWSSLEATDVGDAELRQRFNNVKFLFGSSATRHEMVVKPENFLFSPAQGLVCLAIRSSEDINQPGINILGGLMILHCNRMIQTPIVSVLSGQVALAQVTSMTQTATLVGFLSGWFVIYSSSSTITALGLRSLLPTTPPALRKFLDRFDPDVVTEHSVLER